MQPEALNDYAGPKPEMRMKANSHYWFKRRSQLKLADGVAMEGLYCHLSKCSTYHWSNFTCTLLAPCRESSLTFYHTVTCNWWLLKVEYPREVQTQAAAKSDTACLHKGLCPVHTDAKHQENEGMTWHCVPYVCPQAFTVVFTYFTHINRCIGLLFAIFKVVDSSFVVLHLLSADCSRQREGNKQVIKLVLKVCHLRSVTSRCSRNLAVLSMQFRGSKRHVENSQSNRLPVAW